MNYLSSISFLKEPYPDLYSHLRRAGVLAFDDPKAAAVCLREFAEIVLRKYLLSNADPELWLSELIHQALREGIPKK